MHTSEKYYTCHQLLVEELSTASIYYNVPCNKTVSAIIFCAKQTLPRQTIIQKPFRKVYYGICETTFKLRYANHKKMFNHRNCKSDTELSNEFLKIKDNKRNVIITWENLSRLQAYNRSRKRCSLCSNEKLKIELQRNNNMLNRQT